MKTNKTLLILVIIGTFAFTGCQSLSNLTENPETENNSSKPEEVVNLRNIDQTTQYSLADQAAYDGALELLDKSFCEKISDKNLLNRCNTEIDNNLISKDAIDKRDGKLCEQLSTQDLQDACKISVEKEKTKENIQKEKEVAINQDREIVQKAIDSNDLAACKNIKDPNFLIECELNILVNEGTRNQDISVCEKASTDESKKLCFEEEINMINT